MRRTADREIIQAGAIVSSRTRSHIIDNSEYISSPLTQYRAAMNTPDFFSQLTSLKVEVDNFIENFTRDPDWVFSYVEVYESKVERLKKLRESDPNNPEIAELLKTLEDKKKQLDEAAQPPPPRVPQPSGDGESLASQELPGHVFLQNSIPGVRLLTGNADGFLSLEQEGNLLSDLERLNQSITNPSMTQKLAMSLGGVVVDQQHALRLVRDDVNSLNRSINTVSRETSARAYNVEKSINNVVESLNNMTASALDDRRSLLSRLDRLEKLVTDLSRARPDVPTGDRQGQPDHRQSTPIDEGEALSQEPTGSQRPGTTNILGNLSNEYVPTPAPSNIQARKTLTENSIADLLAQILECIEIEISDDISDALLAECHSKKAPILKQDIAQLNKSVDHYLKEFPSHDPGVVDSVSKILRRARSWISSVSSRYNLNEVYRPPSSKENPIQLEKFDPESEMDIFEFITKFERKFRLLGSNAEKSEKLWGEFLPDHVKVKTEPLKSKFKELKDFLVKKYGSLNFILQNTLKLVEKQKSKTTAQYSSRLALFTKVLLLIQKLENLKDLIAVPTTTWEATVFSVTTLNRLIDILNPSEWETLANKLTEAGEDTDDVAGSRAFEIFKTTCQAFVNTLSRSAGKEHHIQANPVFANFSPKAPPPVVEEKKKFEKFCSIKGHYHPLRECEMFWKSSPSDRRSSTRPKICLTCLGLKKFCRKKCKFEPPVELICQSCEKDSGLKINRLLCTRGHQWNVPTEKLTGLLQILVPGVEVSWILGKNKVNAPHNMSNNCDKSERVLNTKSGKFFISNNIVRENSGPSALLSQWINVGGEPYLLFFDTGASNNIISKSLALNPGVEFINADSLVVTGVGGAEVPSTLGTYRISLGPTKDGKFFEAYCTAMDTVTVDFPEFPVSDVQEETFSTHPELVCNFPQKIGGGPVSLLLGMKDPSIQPVLKFTLPSGVAIFESKFTDVFGSNLIVGGTHPSFQNSWDQTSNFVLYLNTLSPIRQTDPHEELEEIFQGKVNHIGKNFSDENFFAPPPLR